MFRQASSILLLVIVAIQISGKWLVLADYSLNKEFIARTLCINKNKPAMRCKGQCHLRKQLQKEDSGGEQQANRSSQQKFQEVIAEPNSYTAPELTVAPGTTQNLSHTDLYTYLHASSIFHPPGVSLC